jgi:hypothetical protein
MNTDTEVKQAVGQKLASGAYAGNRRGLASDNAFNRVWRFTTIVKRMRSCRLPLLLWLVAAGTLAQGQSLTIGYTNCLAVANYSPSLMNQIGQTKWYFAHASVGECIMEGVANLHLANPSFYPLQGNSASSSPPGTTQAGVIYTDDRGNPVYYGDYPVKLDLFQTAVNNGWHFPAVNIAMTKFCFIDIWYATSSSTVASLLNSYVNSMTNLEAAYPQTVFVYATMPLTTTNYQYSTIDTGAFDIYWRNVFNDSLRAWCSANNRVLFDIADIEAHDTNGNLCTFTYNTRVCQQLWRGYNVGCNQYCNEAGDGAHPTNVEAEQLLAQGFYALAAATVSRWSSAAPAPLIGPITLSNGAAIITWSAATGHTYRLQFQDTLSPANWNDVPPDILAVAATASATNSVGSSGTAFYRVRLVQ